MGATPPHSPSSPPPFCSLQQQQQPSPRLGLFFSLPSCFCPQTYFLLIPVALFFFFFLQAAQEVPTHRCSVVSGGRNSSFLGCSVEKTKTRATKIMKKLALSLFTPRGVLGRPVLPLSITLQAQCFSFHHEGISWMVLTVLPRASWLLSEGLTLRLSSPRQQRIPRS